MPSSDTSSGAKSMSTLTEEHGTFCRLFQSTWIDSLQRLAPKEGKVKVIEKCIAKYFWSNVRIQKQ